MGLVKGFIVMVRVSVVLGERDRVRVRVVRDYG